MAETQGGSHATKSATHSPQRIISCLRRSAACATVSLAGSFEGMRPTGAVGSPRGNTLCPLAGAGSTSGILCLYVYLQNVPNSPGKKVVEHNGGFQLTIFFVLGSIKIQTHQFLL